MLLIKPVPPILTPPFIRTMSQKPMQLGSPNVTKKCFTISPGNPFIPRPKVTGQGHTVPAWVTALL